MNRNRLTLSFLTWVVITTVLIGLPATIQAQQWNENSSDYASLFLVHKLRPKAVNYEYSTNKPQEFVPKADDRVSLKLEIDYNGRVVRQSIVSASHPELGTLFQDLIRGMTFEPIRELDDKLGLICRADFYRLNLEQENWAMVLWDNNYFNVAPQLMFNPEWSKSVLFSDLPVWILKYLAGQKYPDSIAVYKDSDNIETRPDTATEARLKQISLKNTVSYIGKPVKSKYEMWPIKIKHTFGTLDAVIIARPALDNSPALLSTTAPIYPEHYKRMGIIGRCTVLYVVNENGNVENIWIEKTTLKGFAISVMEWLEKAKFKPGTINGVPVMYRIRQRFDFQLDGDKEYLGYHLKNPKDKEAYFKILPKYDKPPDPIHIVDPVYPLHLLLEKREGKAKIFFVVDETGRPKQMAIVENNDDPAFGQSALAAMAYFRFRPAENNGRPVIFAVTWQFEFDLDNLYPWEKKALSEMRKQKLQLANNSELDSKPKPVVKREAEFPYGKDFSDRQGNAKVSFIVDEKGRVLFPEIVEATNPIIGYAFATSVNFWGFRPALQDGKPVKCRVRIPINYDLKNNEEDNAELPGW